MSHCAVTLSANAGVALHLGGARLWFDALHRDRVPGFSTVTPALLEAMEADGAFHDPDLILCSHCHADHYARPMLAAARVRYPDAALILPEAVFPGQVLLEGQELRLSRKGLDLRFGRLPHDGKQYADVPHYGCIVSDGAFRVLLTGDCAVGAAELAGFAGDQPIDLALVNFPWLTLPRGRQLLETRIRPAHLLVCHLPFAGDDRWGYRTAALRSLEKTSLPDVRLLLEPLQREVFGQQPAAGKAPVRR